jgi:WD40 repeat protein
VGGSKPLALLAKHDKGGGVPCTALGIVHGVAAPAGFADGHIRIFHLGDCEDGGEGKDGGVSKASAHGRFMEVEAMAHVGACSALAVHPRLPVFATAGQDGVVCIWSLPEIAGLKHSGTPSKSVGRLVLDLCSRVSKTALLTGLGFAPAPGSGGVYHLLLAAYDSLSMVVQLSI